MKITLKQVSSVTLEAYLKSPSSSARPTLQCQCRGPSHAKPPTSNTLLRVRTKAQYPIRRCRILGPKSILYRKSGWSKGGRIKLGILLCLYHIGCLQLVVIMTSDRQSPRSSSLSMCQSWMTRLEIWCSDHSSERSWWSRQRRALWIKTHIPQACYKNKPQSIRRCMVMIVCRSWHKVIWTCPKIIC